MENLVKGTAVVLLCKANHGGSLQQPFSYTKNITGSGVPNRDSLLCPVTL